ncbi:hypothetical protein GB928_018545 [Shinella curvata]|uniref:Uncharacterized protein n=1 Tax=Shinella curvata TaxID=1817964 RepID=A0ABT8XHH0_9HYPH|nr:hypothetical protein [Shinella curvata]MCJ8053859.1 hypothetical protein [Shinella curvata]MDO6123191.1 hypothetical protein [Shinella curvata]
MPDALYARLQATADRLIKKFGQQGTVTRVAQSGPAYDPVLTPTDYPCQLVVMEYEDRAVDGTLILRTDKLIYIATHGLSITLDRADTINAGGQTFAIENVKQINPAGLVVYYEVQGRA